MFATRIFHQRSLKIVHMFKKKVTYRVIFVSHFLFILIYIDIYVSVAELLHTE